MIKYFKLLTKKLLLTHILFCYSNKNNSYWSYDGTYTLLPLLPVTDSPEYSISSISFLKTCLSESVGWDGCSCTPGKVFQYKHVLFPQLLLFDVMFQIIVRRKIS